MIKTVMTTTGVNAINFGNTADRYYWCKNIGETTLYVSAKEAISPDADDVAMLEPGDIVMIETYNQDIYVLGEGKIEIHESDTLFCPFKSAAKGGGSGGNSLLETITEFPVNPTDNKPYLFRNSDIGNIIAVHFDSTWHFATLNQYPFEHMLYAADLYSIGQVIETPSESVSVINRTKEFTDKTFTSAVKISGMGSDNQSFIFEMSIDFRSASTAKVYVGISAESADKCTIYLNGDVVKTIESTSTSETSVEDVYEISITPTAGVNTLKFSYNKDSSNSYGEDAVFIYGVRFTTG